tara:strand:- start:2223 stop:2366 length:144 start_codon:yes stop_codon:yes gene_type:complete
MGWRSRHLDYRQWVCVFAGASVIAAADVVVVGVEVRVYLLPTPLWEG